MDLLFKPHLMIGACAEGRRYPISARLFSAHCDKQEIYRLRYRAFERAGWIEPSDLGELSDAFDELPTAFSIKAMYKGDCVGALRLLFGGKGAEPSSMPCELEFPHEIGQLATGQNGERRMVEFSRMAVDPAIDAKTFRAVIYASLVRAGLIVAYAAEADFAVAAVHQRISRFYELMCGFRLVAKAPSYGRFAEPTHLLGRDFGALDQRRKARNVFFRIMPDEIEAARDLMASMAAPTVPARGEPAEKRRA